MIDHVLGRPSLQFRKFQVLLVLVFWTTYLVRGNSHGPPIPLLRRVSRFFTKRLTAFQTVTITMLYLYIARNFAKLLGLESPEPLANLYTRSYFRATWVMTALDAGFWTAMRVRRKWLRDLCSVVFSVYYLFAAERADEKVRRVRATMTVDHLRVSWEKSQSPYLRILSSLLSPSSNRFSPRPLRIPRPRESSEKEPVEAWLYFEGTREELLRCSKLVLDIPGGGFVAMSPRHHDEKLLAWSRLCPGTPVVSINYKKAPEYPYPYALHSCFDVYHLIVASRGRCVGLSGEVAPKIVLTGDSAGGNYAAGIVLMVLNSTSLSSTDHLISSGLQGLPLPEGLILIYPSLDLSISSWMTDEQMKLIRQRDTLQTNRPVLRRKRSEYYNKASRAPSPSSSSSSLSSLSYDVEQTAVEQTAVEAPQSRHHSHPGTQLAMSSRLSYFNDRILTPEMMRAMVMLYIGPHRSPDFSSDYLLSPLVAPESLLARFPQTFFLTGERDPLVDDTVIFAGRIRAAKRAVRRHRLELGLETRNVDREEAVRVSLIAGISHGFLNMGPLFPQARTEMERCAGWINELFEGGLEDGGEDEEEENETLEIGGGLEGRGRGEKRSNVRGRGRGKGRGRRGSAVSLGSEEDIVDRRMKGLVEGLTGLEEGDRVENGVAV